MSMLGEIVWCSFVLICTSYHLNAHVNGALDAVVKEKLDNYQQD